MVDRSSPSRDVLLRILDRARWAPSGDNTQPWRFQVIADDYVIVHGHDTRDEILYDFDGHASHMAHGALLETLRIAASVEGLAASWEIESDKEQRKIKYHVRLAPATTGIADPLAPFIEQRCVQRRPMRLQSLTDTQRSALIAAAGEDFEVRLFESFSERRKIAKLLWNNAYIRLTCPEAYPVHASIIEWNARFSKDRIPEQAVGVDPITAKLMRWVMGSWGRVEFFNRYLMGTIAPRVQLDYLPAICCSAHALIVSKRGLNFLGDWVALGQAMQRFWLAASWQGLYLQPEMTPLIFGWYAASARKFSADVAVEGCAKGLTENLLRVFGCKDAASLGFFCRVGMSRTPNSRSMRLGLDELLIEGGNER